MSGLLTVRSLSSLCGGKPVLLPAAYQERLIDARRMYRDGARQTEIVAKHGSIVAREALEDLNRNEPRWWAQ